MATWQFALHLVPRAVSPSDRDPWRLRQPAGNWRRALGGLLPRGSSWSPQLGVWGTEAGHRVEIWEHGGRVESILVRIDAREPIERLAPFCQDLAAFAQAQGDVVFTSAPAAVIEPTAAALSEAIAASEAWRSVHHREAFIRPGAPPPGEKAAP